jgi:hypothetical protein
MICVQWIRSITLSIGLLAAHGLQAQVKIDLKTPYDEKYELRYIKTAAKQALENSTSFKVTEFGEKYSLWVLNPEQRLTRDGEEVSFDLELRTPAAITRGKHLVSRRIVFLMARGQDYSALDSLGFQSQNLLLSSLVGNVAGMAVQAATIYTGGAIPILVSAVGLNVDGLIAGITSKLGTPTKGERWRAVMAAQYIAAATYEMVIEVEQ